MNEVMEKPVTTIAEYNATAAAIAELRQKYEGVLFDVTTKEGLAAAIKGRAELRGYRVALEKIRVEIKAPALKRTQEIDSEARRIAAALSSLEDPIDDQIKADERRKAAEAAAKVKAEADRIAAEEAARKAEEERIMAEQRAEIERQREELAAKQRAVEAAQRAEMGKIEAEQRAAREKFEAEQLEAIKARREADRLAQEARDKADAEARAKREAEERRIREAQEKVDAERREIEERERKARFEAEERARIEREAKEAEERAKREAEEAKEREIRRAAAELEDGTEMLRAFVSTYGKREEFKGIAKAIGAFLGGEK